MLLAICITSWHLGGPVNICHCLVKIHSVVEKRIKIQSGDSGTEDACAQASVSVASQAMHWLLYTSHRRAPLTLTPSNLLCISLQTILPEYLLCGSLLPGDSLQALNPLLLMSTGASAHTPLWKPFQTSGVNKVSALVIFLMLWPEKKLKRGRAHFGLQFRRDAGHPNGGGRRDSRSAGQLATLPLYSKSQEQAGSGAALSSLKTCTPVLTSS